MIAYIRTLLIVIALVLSTGFHAPSLGASEEREGGLVGTGLGLLGVISEIGSIWVNGLRITYPTDLRVETAFGTEPVSRLAVGETVQVEAQKVGSVWRAFSIQRYQPMISTVQSISPEQTSIVVLGTGVDLAPGLILSTRLRVGDWVEVSGLWRGERLVASKVTRIAPQPEHAVRGMLRVAADGTSRIGALAIEGLRPGMIRPGKTLAVRGIPLQGPGGMRLRATRYAVKGFSQRAGRVLVEGYLSNSNAQSQYTVYGSGIVAQADGPFIQMPRWRGLHCATQGRNGEPVIRSLIQLPEEERLRRIVTGSTQNDRLQNQLDRCR